MMPLTVAGVGVASTIKKIGGKRRNKKVLRKSGVCSRWTVIGRIRNRWKHDC